MAGCCMSAVAESPVERLIRREQQIAAHRPAGFADYAAYEAAKTALALMNPTPEEYERAVAAIAHRCGV